MREGPHRPERLGLDPRIVWGVSAGSCIAGEQWYDKRYHIEGHAHYVGPWRGWICLPDTDRIVTPPGRPTLLVLHEVAHLMAGNKGHGADWREALIGLGGKAEANRYLRRSDGVGAA